jgi:hypothetical protein
MSGAIPLLPLYAFMKLSGITLPFNYIIIIIIINQNWIELLSVVFENEHLSK